MCLIFSFVVSCHVSHGKDATSSMLGVGIFSLVMFSWSCNFFNFYETSDNILEMVQDATED